MGSLRNRLGAGLLISLVAVFGLLWVLVSGSIRYLAEDYTASRLEHDAQTLLGALTIAEDGTTELDQSRLGAIYLRPFSGHYFTILIDGQTIRSRSLWDQSLTVRPAAPGTSQRSRAAGPQGQPLLMLSAGYSKGGRQLTVAIAEDLSVIEQDIDP